VTIPSHHAGVWGLATNRDCALDRVAALLRRSGRRHIDPHRLAAVAGLPEREAARRLGVPRSTLQRFKAVAKSKATSQDQSAALFELPYDISNRKRRGLH